MVIVIDLPYDAARAVDRLRPLVVPPSRQRDLTSGERVPLVGKVGLDGVHVKANTIYRSSFAGEGHGVFTRVAGTRCRLELQVGVSVLPLLGVAVWFATVLAIGYRQLPAGYEWWQILTTAPGAWHLALMLGVGIALCGFGLFLSRSEAAQIEDTIRGALGAPTEDSAVA